MKKRSKETKTLRAGCSKAEPKIFNRRSSSRRCTPRYFFAVRTTVQNRKYGATLLLDSFFRRARRVVFVRVGMSRRRPAGLTTRDVPVD